MAVEAGNQPFLPPPHFLTNFTSDALLMSHMIGGTTTTFLCPPSLVSGALPVYAKEADGSGLTCNNNNRNNILVVDELGALPSSRKRSRDHGTVPYGYGCHNDDSVVSQRIKSSPSWFEQWELDCLLAQHTQRLILGIEERERKQSKALVSAIRAAVATKLREKEEEIQGVTKLNWALQERIRSLSAENQLWRGLAQSNEAAVNSLRTDLERVLTTARERNEEDAESCCGSNEDEVGRTQRRRRCRGCEGWLEEEVEAEGRSSSAGVMVMPCRHVFMQCSRCNESSRQSCPVCGSQITATLHVHLP